MPLPDNYAEAQRDALTDTQPWERVAAEAVLVILERRTYQDELADGMHDEAPEDFVLGSPDFDPDHWRDLAQEREWDF